MKTRIIIIGIIITLVLFSFVIYNNIQKEDIEMEDKKQQPHQGPVPEGYDLEHFRKTGETKPLGEVKE